MRTAFKDIASLKGRSQELDETNALLQKERESLLAKATSLQSTCPEDLVNASELQRQLRIAEEQLRISQEKAMRAEQIVVQNRKKK